MATPQTQKRILDELSVGGYLSPPATWKRSNYTLYACDGRPLVDVRESTIREMQQKGLINDLLELNQEGR